MSSFSPLHLSSLFIHLMFSFKYTQQTQMLGREVLYPRTQFCVSPTAPQPREETALKAQGRAVPCIQYLLHCVTNHNLCLTSHVHPIHPATAALADAKPMIPKCRGISDALCWQSMLILEEYLCACPGFCILKHRVFWLQ